MVTGKSMADIRVGVVGFGLAGRVFHAPFVSAVPGLRLTGIVQRSGDDAARAYPSATVYRSIEDLLKSDVDLIVGRNSEPRSCTDDEASPDGRKNMSSSISRWRETGKERRRLRPLAKERGSMLSPFHCSRWHGDFTTLKHVVNAGTLGRLVTVEAKMDRYRPIPRTLHGRK